MQILNQTVTEEWRPFLGVYEVSSLGVIRRAKPGGTNARVGNVAYQHVNKAGYKLVRLRENGRTRTFVVHNVVAEAFMGPKPRGLVVNHIDRDRGNNAAANLEYITQRDNILHSRENLARAVGKLTEDDVRAIRAALKSGATQRSLEKQHGLSKGAVSHIARGKTWTHVQ